MLLTQKTRFLLHSSCSIIRYKRAGSHITDERGTLDTVEYINIAKDDAISYPNVAIRHYPPIVTGYMESTIKPFVNKSLDVNNTILSIFETKLGMPKGTLLKLHALYDPSGSEARVIKKSPALTEFDQKKIALGAHTDFGSLSFLHNRLGGLQVIPPGSGSRWMYVRPLPGHAICNVGDALTLFSGGILHSCVHRVVSPPGLQAPLDRWSVVFFTRPGDDVPLDALVNDSDIVKETVEYMDAGGKEKFFPGVNATEWFVRRATGRRIKNKKASVSCLRPWTFADILGEEPRLLECQGDGACICSQF